MNLNLWGCLLNLSLGTFLHQPSSQNIMQFELQRRTINNKLLTIIFPESIQENTHQRNQNMLRIVIKTNSFIISMNLKYNQTDRKIPYAAFGNTLRINSNRISIRTRKSNSKSMPKQSSTKKSTTQIYLLSKIVSSKKNIATTNANNNLKSRFDHLVNDLFMKIDFDCSGFITFTKISYCKQIPEDVFYFLGGVFQKVRQLGGITMKTFQKLCEEAFIQAKLQDIEKVLEQSHKTSRKTQAIQKNIAKIDKQNKYRLKTQTIQSRQSLETKREFSTKKTSNSLKPYQKYSLKLQTQPSLKKTSIFRSQIKLKPVQGLKFNRLELSYRQTSHSQEKSISFQEDKVRVLTERLDNQLSRNNKRFLTNKFIY